MQDATQDTRLTGYQSPLAGRYASKAMQRLFSDGHRAKVWRQVWIALAEAEQALGLPITDSQIAQMKQAMDAIDLDSVARYEKRLRHDVMAHVHAYGDLCPEARPVIHLGATSCTVTDNGDMVIYREGLMYLRGQLVTLARHLADFAMRYRDMPCLGFTHYQPAQPTTVGKRATLWLQDVLSDLQALDHFIKGMRPLGAKGTTGTQASFMSLFDGDFDKVKRLDHDLCRRLGFDKPVAVSGQTYSRKTDADILDLFSQIAQTAHKFAGDIRLLAHDKEIEEPFEKDQIGSSAMAYKRNPMRSERLCALARFLITNQQNAAFTAAGQWLERTLDDSANRRLAMAHGFLATDSALRLFINIVDGLVVYPRMIARNLARELPFMATENLLMQAVLQGGDRQSLHEVIRRHSVEAARLVKEEGADNQLLDFLADDPAFPLNKEDIARVADPAQFIGAAALQTEDYINTEVADILSRFPEEAAKQEEITV